MATKSKGFKKIKQITAWGATRLADYEACPRRACYKYVEKVPVQGPESPAMARGTRLHTCAENYISGRRSDVAEELSKAKKVLGTLRDAFKKRLVRTEMELAFNRAWKPCHWMADDVYVRIKMDILWLAKATECLVIDWKTGKYKPDGEYGDQLRLYQVGALLAPYAAKAQVARAQLYFTDVGKPVVHKDEDGKERLLRRKDLIDELAQWDERVKPMLADRHFAPRPGIACRYCDYSCQKDGPCEF
jgi:hypothetical protein